MFPDLFRRVANAFVFFMLAACHHPPIHVSHDAYIWQRVWTPAVAQAMRDSAADIRQWRVLAAHTDHAG